MLIPLDRIVPNPYRDFDLYPLDNAQVDKLVHSINRHGFFAGVVGRYAPDGKRVQIAMGHHRVEAGRKVKLGKIEIDVRDISDDEMIRLMTSENAIQAGSKIAAVMNEVSAAVRRLAKAMLSADDLAGIPARWPEIHKCFQSGKAYETARGTLLGGDGIGWKIIRGYLGGGGDEDLCPRSKDQIVDALAAIKASGIYAKTIGEVRDEIAREQADAEREVQKAEAEAERAEKTAKTKGDKARATKAKTKAKNAREHQTKSKAKERADRAANTSREKHKRVFDERCIGVFANDDQAHAFREAVTTDAARRFIAVDQQLKVAKELMASIGAGNAQENRNNRNRISAAYIKTYVAGVIQDAIRKQHDIDEQEQQRLIDQQQDEVFHGKIKDLLWAVRSVGSIAHKLGDMIDQNPKWGVDARLGAISAQINDAITALQTLKGAIDGTRKAASTAKHRQITNGTRPDAESP